jgi:hypothetical protein
VHRLRQLEDLVREVEQLDVLLVLFLDRPPLQVGDHLALCIGPVLADHHERREEDRLERNDHRQQPVRVVLDTEHDPAAEPRDVDVDEGHGAGERRDPIRDAVLHTLGPLPRVFEQGRVGLQ